MKILVIDDSKVVLQQFKRFAQSAEIEILTAEDGPAGIKVATANSDLDAIFTDYNMPGMDGITVCREMRKIEAHQKTTLIMCTTESDTELREAGKKLGVRFWIIKPIDFEAISKIIHKITG